MEKIVFKDFIKTLDPKYNLLGCKFSAETALSEYEKKESTDMYNTVQWEKKCPPPNVTHFSIGTCEPYLSSTEHYIDKWEFVPPNWWSYRNINIFTITVVKKKVKQHLIICYMQLKTLTEFHDFFHVVINCVRLFNDLKTRPQLEGLPW